MQFRDAVKQLRNELALTQNDPVNALHVNYATVGRWGTGKTFLNCPLISVLIECAGAKPIPAEYLACLYASVDSLSKEKFWAVNDKFRTVIKAACSDACGARDRRNNREVQIRYVMNFGGIGE